MTYSFPASAMVKEFASNTHGKPVWNVPSPLTSFIGRESEVQQICSLLLRPDLRLLTLVGTGGVGKTRLSIQVVQKLRDHFAYGIYFVSLSSISSPDLVSAALAHALGLNIKGERTLHEQVKEFLCGKEILLILDNFEHVACAASLVEELLFAYPQLKILITSRAALYLHGQQEYSLLPLRIPTDTHLLTKETLLGYEAVALLVQRVKAIIPAFELTEENAAAIAHICVHLDGLPLAIELAAARLKHFSPQTVLEKLAQRFSLLTSRVHSSSQRQQTLWETLTWSYDLLNPQEQSLFKLFAIFRNGATLEAIEHILEIQQDQLAAPIMDIISLLLDKSLLTFQDGYEGNRRFLMLETVQAYALERLQEMENADMLRGDHAHYYLAYAEQHECDLKGQKQRIWLAHFDQERENFRTALQWFIDHQEIEMALRLCSAIFRFEYLRGYWSELRTLMKTVLDLAQTLSSTAAYIRVLSYYSEVAFYHSNMQAIGRALQESLKQCDELNFPYEHAYGRYRLSFYYHEQGNLEMAHTCLRDAERICRSQNYIWELAHILRTRGYIAWSIGDCTQASSLTRESLKIARMTGDQALIAKVLSLQLVVITLQGDFVQAVALNQEILIMAQQLEDKYLIATALQNLGYLTAQIGDNPQAITFVHQGLALFRELGYTFLTANALHSLGYVAARQGHTQLATNSFREGLTLALEIANDTQIGWHLIGWAGVLTTQGHYQQATQLLGAAEKRFDLKAQMNTNEQGEYREMVQMLLHKLSKQLFDKIWQEGREMNIDVFLYEHDIEEQIAAVTFHQLPPNSPRETCRSLGLTKREIEILRGVTRGLTDAQIADELVISTRTVNWHLSNIYSKLQISSRSAATRITLEHGLL